MKVRNIVVNLPEQHKARAPGRAVRGVVHAARPDRVAVHIGCESTPGREFDRRAVQCLARADRAAAGTRQGGKAGIVQRVFAHRAPKPGLAAAPTPMESSA